MSSYLPYCHVLSLFLSLCRHSSCSLLIHSFASLESQSLHCTFLHSGVLSYNDQYESPPVGFHSLIFSLLLGDGAYIPTYGARGLSFSTPSHHKLFPSYPLCFNPIGQPSLIYSFPDHLLLPFHYKRSTISLYHLGVQSGASLESQPSCWDSWIIILNTLEGFLYTQ